MNVALVFGTRPETIKMAPIIKELSGRGHVPTVIVTAQHRDMLDQHLKDFGIVPDIDLDIMEENQDLAHVAAQALRDLNSVLAGRELDALLVQGDTTTTFAASLAAFYHRIPVGHVESGLRTWKKYQPFPEEINRKLTTQLAQWHFAPTIWARDNLLKEGIQPESVFLTGNTVVDALLDTLKSITTVEVPGLQGPDLSDRRIVLLTAHRRESFGAPLERVFRACLAVIERAPDVELVYPVHPNPNVGRAAHAILANHKNVKLLPPLDYRQFVKLMSISYLILTDSGGIQEEAPSLGKPVLVLREVTERPEAIDAGTAKLVGTDESRIISEALHLLSDQKAYRKMAGRSSPFGDGTASVKIVDILESQLTSVRA